MMLQDCVTQRIIINTGFKDASLPVLRNGGLHHCTGLKKLTSLFIVSPVIVPKIIPSGPEGDE
jgi:hypothetical protein